MYFTIKLNNFSLFNVKYILEKKTKTKSKIHLIQAKHISNLIKLTVKKMDYSPVAAMNKKFQSIY